VKILYIVVFLKAKMMTAHVTCRQGVQNDHICGIPARGHIAYSLYNFYGVMATIKSRL